MSETAGAGTWKRVVAAILDFFTVFLIGGYVIGKLTGGTTDNGFSLDGWPALVLIALIIAYFLLGRRYLGGTLWDRVFRIPRARPANSV